MSQRYKKRKDGTELPSADELFDILDNESSRMAVRDDFLSTQPTLYEAYHALGGKAGVDTSWVDSYKDITLNQIDLGLRRAHEGMTAYIHAHPEDSELYERVYQSLVLEDAPARTEAIFVFGSVSNMRIERAVELYHDGIAPKIILSGRSPHYAETHQTEAERMAEYAVERGVPRDDLILEGDSITLPDNVKRTLDVLEQMEWRPESLTIIATDFVLARAKREWYSFCPWDMTLHAVAARPSKDAFTVQGWYRDDAAIALVLNEYAKFVFEAKMSQLRQNSIDGKVLPDMVRPDVRQHILPWVDPAVTITPTAIILHWWEEPVNRGGIELLEELWRERGLASQFAVLADGTIYQLTPHENSFSKHAKNANQSAIGIEIQGMGADDLDSNEIQFRAVVALTRYLTQKYAIAPDFRVEHQGHDTMRFHGVTSHKNVDPYCDNANGKQDVHDAYLERVIADL